jgi:hypothetical protein
MQSKKYDHNDLQVLVAWGSKGSVIVVAASLSNLLGDRLLKTQAISSHAARFGSNLLRRSTLIVVVALFIERRLR